MDLLAMLGARTSFKHSLRLFLTLALVAIAGSATAQTYLTEDFETAFPGSNFALAGSGPQWTVNTTYFFGGGHAAYFKSVAGAANQNGGYLMSKMMDLTTSTRPLLSFWHIAAL